MSDRQQHWDRIYTQRAAQQLSWFQQEPRISLQLIHRCQLQLDDAIIDVGGGASHLVDCLLKEGYQRLLVLDISARSLQLVQQRLGADASRVTWLVEDVTGFTSPTGLALWHDRAVFHFLTNAAERQRYVQVLNNSLRTGGFVIIAAFAIGGPTQCSGLDIVQYDAQKLLQELGPGFRLLEEVSELHLTPSQQQQAFNYYRLLKL